jgi:glycosyltransferase involved in cell wall biosynthesis
MRWLVISPYLPHPGVGHGGGTAVRQLCEELARHHRTTLLCFERETEAGLDRWLTERGVEVRTLPWRSDQAHGLSRIGLIADRARVLLAQQRHDRPFMVEKYDRAALHRAINRILDAEPFDVVQVEYSFLAPAARRAREHPSHPAVLLNTHEIASLPRERELARARGPVEQARARQALRRWTFHEAMLPECADRILCVTEQDRQRMIGLLGDADRLVTVPLGYEIPEFADAHLEPVQPPRLLFVGGFTHPPNVEGARALVEEILPRVLVARPEIRVDVVGAQPPDWLRRASDASEGRLVVHGFVDDLAAVFRASTLFVAPLFTGGGIKIKVLEAMARGAAVLSTPIGVEGIDDEGHACAIAATPEEFADGILALVSDVSRRRELSRRARAHVADGFSWPSIVDRLGRIAAEVRSGNQDGQSSSPSARQGGSGRGEP